MFNPKSPNKSASESSAEFLKNLYPELSPNQREEVAYNLDRYLDVIESIYHHMDSQGMFDEERKNSRLKEEWNKRSKGSSRVAKRYSTEIQSNKKRRGKSLKTERGSNLKSS